MGHRQDMLDAIWDHVGDAMVLADSDGVPVRVNRAFEALTGYSFAALLASAGKDGAFDPVRQALSGGDSGRWYGELRCGDGAKHAFQMTIHKVAGENGAITHVLGLLRRAGEELYQQPTHDELTGLPSREIFPDRVQQALLQANRSGGSVALLLMGLDHFTTINDALGHGAGDRLLVEVARRLRQNIREIDTAVRLAGDKFAVVMNVAETDDSVIVAEKMLKAVRDPFLLDGQEVVVSFSIGIALYPQDAATGPSLLKQADNALHHAKTSGRNQYQFFSRDMNLKARQRLELEARLRRALANQEFAVYYQPKVRAADSRIVGAEALVRWIDPERGLISPIEFISVAEETGLIEPIGAWVLRRSCQQTRAWQEQGLSPVKVSVNVSPRQFRSRSLVDTVVAILNESGLDSRWLELEITESMLMNDVEAAVRKMADLRQLGIGLSIDDFGTGYSSLSYLGRFPITTLKIDRAFISDVDTNPKTAEIARAIIGLSRGLNLEVVAEGAEVEDHVRFLRDNGCDTVQGYYFSKPVPSEQFERMLASGFLVRD